MISYENLVAENLYMEGFSTTVEKGMTLNVEAGSFNYVTEDEILTTQFPAFTFDVESDAELRVVYDVYLLDGKDENGVNIHIDRTELNDNAVAFYEGKAKLLHSLISFVVPPNTKDLSKIDIKIRNMQLPESDLIEEV